MERSELATWGSGAQMIHATECLMICPLCGAVNAVENTECFVCRWAGNFDHDREHIEEGLSDLFVRCPELAIAMMERPAPPLKPFQKFLVQFHYFFAEHFWLPKRWRPRHF